MEKNDFSQDVKIPNSVFLKNFYLVLGAISFILAILGIFLPVLPTTPFLLLSAFSFARSSNRLYDLVLNHPLFGKYIQAWRREKKIPTKIKFLALSLLILSLGSSIYFFIPHLILKIILAAIGLAVSIYILRH